MVNENTAKSMIKTETEVDVYTQNFRVYLKFGEDQPGSALYSYVTDITDMTKEQVREEIEKYWENKQEDEDL